MSRMVEEVEVEHLPLLNRTQIEDLLVLPRQDSEQPAAMASDLLGRGGARKSYRPELQIARNFKRGGFPRRARAEISERLLDDKNQL